MRPAPTMRARLALAAAAALALLAGSLAAVPAARAADVRVRAVLEPGEIGPGDDAFFSIEVSGGVFDHVDFRPTFELVNFEQVGGPARSDNLQWVNGVTHRSTKLTWRLRAGDLGIAAVRRISVEVDGERYDLPSRQARVVAEPPSSRRRPLAGQPQPPASPFPSLLEDLWRQGERRREAERPQVRLIAEVTPRSPWVGQQVTYTLWLYTQTSIAQVNTKELPEFRGFWVEEMPRRDDTPTESVELDGETYYRTPLLQRALFALRPGRYDVDPAQAYLVARLAPSNPFAALLPRSEQIERASQPLTLDVRPLPAVPPDLAGSFHGLVGDLSLAARLVPSELAVGDASTLEVKLTGRGNVAGLELPTPRTPAAVEVMRPEESGGNQLDGTTVRADRSWSFPLVPQRPGTWRLPPLQLTYFDPAAGEYRLATAEPLVLRARRGEAQAAAAGGPMLHPLKNAALPLEGAGVPPWRTALPWLFALPWALVLTTVLVRRRRRAAEGPADAADQRFAQRLAVATAEHRPRQSAIALETAWRELLEETHGLPRDLPPSRWRRHLEATGVDERHLAELDELVDDLHYLRHAPELSSVAQLSGELASRSRRLGRRLTA